MILILMIVLKIILTVLSIKLHLWLLDLMLIGATVTHLSSWVIFSIKLLMYSEMITALWTIWFKKSSNN